MTNSIPYLEQAVKWNEQLLGLPALPLVVIGCMVLGLYLKWSPRTENSRIPQRVVQGGIVGYIGLTVIGILIEIRAAADAVEVVMRLIVWMFRAIIFGSLAGVASIVLHRVVLKKIEKRFNWFPTGDTEIIHKPKDPQ